MVRFDRLLSRLEDCGRLIELLARRNVLLDKLLLAPQVGLGLRKSSVVLRKLCLVTGNQRLDLAIIQGEQEIALLDDLAVTDMLLEHLAFDARFHNHDGG